MIAALCRTQIPSDSIGSASRTCMSARLSVTAHAIVQPTPRVYLRHFCLHVPSIADLIEHLCGHIVQVHATSRPSPFVSMLITCMELPATPKNHVQRGLARCLQKDFSKSPAPRFSMPLRPCFPSSTGRTASTHKKVHNWMQHAVRVVCFAPFWEALLTTTLKTPNVERARPPATPCTPPDVRQPPTDLVRSVRGSRGECMLLKCGTSNNPDVSGIRFCTARPRHHASSPSPQATPPRFGEVAGSTLCFPLPWTVM